jgi:hypothetical protein
MSFQYRECIVSVWLNEESGKKCPAGSCGETCGTSCQPPTITPQTTCAAPSAQCGFTYERRTPSALSLLRQQLQAALFVPQPETV